MQDTGKTLTRATVFWSSKSPVQNNKLRIFRANPYRVALSAISHRL